MLNIERARTSTAVISLRIGKDARARCKHADFCLIDDFIRQNVFRDGIDFNWFEPVLGRGEW
jgi:hypothetical protein